MANQSQNILTGVMAAGLAAVTAMWLSQPKSTEEWEFAEEKEETVKMPVDYTVSIDVFKGIGASKGKWSADWERQDGVDGRVFATTKSKAISAAKKEAEKA